jgi:hypothetical protein
MVEKTGRRPVGTGCGYAPSPPEFESPDSHGAQVASSLIKNQHGLVHVLMKRLKHENKVDQTK